jgi:hypothetical protein
MAPLLMPDGNESEDVQEELAAPLHSVVYMASLLQLDGNESVVEEQEGSAAVVQPA